LLLGGGYQFSHSFPEPPYYDFHRDLAAAKDYNGTYSTYAFTNEAIDIINNQDEDTPFFMYLSYQAPHAPLEVPEQYKDPYHNGATVMEGGNNWPLRGFKLSMFEGGMRAIGFVHSPLLSDKVKGTVSNELYHVSDWFPTFVEGIAGWNTDGTKPLDGFNQWESI
ncbi:arylsulfatase B-like, partial [Anneissia japonica]|uniref:arylsulfatase B-like n=1 Tax=Anneissia japonica TaxID=1529436 RepID=UPI001425AF1C